MIENTVIFRIFSLSNHIFFIVEVVTIFLSTLLPAPYTVALIFFFCICLPFMFDDFVVFFFLESCVELVSSRMYVLVAVN